MAATPRYDRRVPTAFQIHDDGTSAAHNFQLEQSFDDYHRRLEQHASGSEHDEVEDDDEDPFSDEEEDVEDHNARETSLESNTTQLHHAPPPTSHDPENILADTRKPSETFSALPDDWSRAGRSPLGYNRSHSRNSQQHPSPSFRAGERPTVFRSPRSVREMQMASPPPFTGSPRSALFRRSQLSNHFNLDEQEAEELLLPEEPRKEYPLVLLHATFTAPALLSRYPAETLRVLLPTAKQRDVALLAERLSPRVMERGVLLTHPQDDYELLEERILEALDLAAPRIGSCGHVRSGIESEGPQDACCEGKCLDCGRHVASTLGGKEPRWEVKVYAANGLMRAGAWAAAWREMEKVDVEIGVALGDELRRELDEHRLLLAVTAPQQEKEEVREEKPVAVNPRSINPPQKKTLLTLLLRFAGRLFATYKDYMLMGLVLCLAIWIAALRQSGFAATPSLLDVSRAVQPEMEMLAALRAENAELQKMLLQKAEDQEGISQVLPLVVTTTIVADAAQVTGGIDEVLLEQGLVADKPRTQVQEALAALARVGDVAEVQCSCAAAGGALTRDPIVENTMVSAAEHRASDDEVASENGDADTVAVDGTDTGILEESADELLQGQDGEAEVEARFDFAEDLAMVETEGEDLLE